MHETVFIPYGRQWLDDDDIAAVLDVLRGEFLTQGPKIREFEEAVAEYVGAKYCVAFCNATAALHCAVKALELPPGSSGITSTNTFVASANCLAYNGLRPGFADIDADSLNITAETLQPRVDNNVRVIIPVHFAGRACDMPAIAELADSHECQLIEDAAHAIGSSYADGSKVGSCSYSQMTVFSFHPVKTITTGEGGVVTTNSQSLYRKLLLLRSHGIEKDPACLSRPPGPWYYEQQQLGYNYRLTDMQCALGLTQLKKLERFKEFRQRIIECYNRSFKELPHVRVIEQPGDRNTCFHLYVLRIDFKALGTTRKSVMAELSSMGIGSQVHYIPVHTQPWYMEQYDYGWGDFPTAEAYYHQALSLPLFPKMTDDEVERVICGVKRVLAS